jgi:hypothetical protein
MLVKKHGHSLRDWHIDIRKFRAISYFPIGAKVKLRSTDFRGEKYAPPGYKIRTGKYEVRTTRYVPYFVRLYLVPLVESRDVKCFETEIYIH